MTHATRWLLTWLLLVGVGLAVPVTAHAQNKKKPEDRIEFNAYLMPGDPFTDGEKGYPTSTASALEVRRGQVVTLVIRGKPEAGWHTYPLTQRTSSQDVGALCKIIFEKGTPVTVLYPIQETKGEFIDTKTDLGIWLEHEHEFFWSIDLLIDSDAEPEARSLNFKIKSQVCDDICVYPTHSFQLPYVISSEEPVAKSTQLERRLKNAATLDVYSGGELGFWTKDVETLEEPRIIFDRATASAPPPTGPNKPGVISPSPSAEGNLLQRLGLGELVWKTETKSQGLWGTIVTAFIGGLVSLLTPCVFPMIPVTVSFFLKQSEKNEGSALGMALVYSGTIVAVLTVGGWLVLPLLIKMSQHAVTNYILAGLFVFFALSLLGMYDITLPNWMTNFTASREGQGGMVGVVFMALSFSIISFACVGPIYGGILAFEASGQSQTINWAKFILGPIAFSVAFAIPFFVLALFPGLLKTMPKSGSWLNSVKVVMGFVELAAAVKFIRQAEIAVFEGSSVFFTFDLCLGLYIAICFACGLYLLNVYRLPHDHGESDSIGVGRLLTSLLFLTIGLYLLPGMFKAGEGKSQKPDGRLYVWTESFLLPDLKGGGEEGWTSDLPDAVARAEDQRKLMFIDFTGLV